MLRRFAALLAVSSLVLSTASPTQAIVKVAPSWGFLEVSGGFAKPVGSYNGTLLGDFRDGQGRPVDVDPDELYDGGYFLKVAMGTIQRDHFQGSVGFGFARNSVNNPVTIELNGVSVSYPWALYGGGDTPVSDLRHSQYDLDLNLNYLPMDIHKQGWSPYVGLGLHGGVSVLSAPDVESERESNAALSLNFGAEIRLFSDKAKRSFATLASINSWDFAASGNRLKYLQLGGGLRWYFKY